MSKKNVKQSNEIVSTGQSLGGGLVVNHGNNSLSIDPQNLDPAHHFFYADHYKLRLNGSYLEMMFAQANVFSSDNEFMAAVQIAFPVHMALTSFYDMVWTIPPSGAVGTFGDTLSAEVQRSAAVYGTGTSNSSYSNHRLPANQNIRKFASNFAISAYSNGEAAIDFYEASPQLIHYAINHGRIRSGDKIHNEFAVILSLATLQEFLLECKGHLEKFAAPSTRDPVKSPSI